MIAVCGVVWDCGGVLILLLAGNIWVNACIGSMSWSRDNECLKGSDSWCQNIGCWFANAMHEHVEIGADM